jgi:hypothetical protein
LLDEWEHSTLWLLTVDKTQELCEVAGFSGLRVRKESLAILPVSETETLLSGNTTEVDD